MRSTLGVFRCDFKVLRCIDAICIMHHACIIDLLLRVDLGHSNQTFHFLFSISLTACRTWCTKGRKIMG